MDSETDTDTHSICNSVSSGENYKVCFFGRTIYQICSRINPLVRLFGKYIYSTNSFPIVSFSKDSDSIRFC